MNSFQIVKRTYAISIMSYIASSTQAAAAEVATLVDHQNCKNLSSHLQHSCV
jgi:hypothetical protein